jgi:uncharacterized protein YneR
MSIQINIADLEKELKIVVLKGDILQISYGQNEFMVALDDITAIEIFNDEMEVEEVNNMRIYRHVSRIFIYYGNFTCTIKFDKNGDILDSYKKYESVLKSTYIKLKQIWFSYKKRMSVEAITGIPLDTK